MEIFHAFQSSLFLGQKFPEVCGKQRTCSTLDGFVFYFNLSVTLSVDILV